MMKINSKFLFIFNNLFWSQKLLKFAFIVLLLYVAFSVVLLFFSEEPKTQEAKARKENVLVVFSVSPDNCTMPIGESIYEQSYLNKRQYAHLRGYDIIYNRRQPDSKVTGNYNKVSLLREILRNESSLPKESRHEWLIWMDYDTLVSDMSHTIDFSRFSGRDLVIWGNWFALNVLVDGWHGVNGGVLYLRNTEWSARFLDLVLDFGRDRGRAREDEMRRRMFRYNPVLFEQNAITYVLKTQPHLQKKLYLESVHKINMFWDLFGGWYHRIPFFHPFIVHFAGCQFCWYPAKTGCLETWKPRFDQANRQYSRQFDRLKLPYSLNLTT